MKYNPALDGIRALAVLGVVAYHCDVPYLGGGKLGVDVFFVLSGYLITSILKREQESGGIRLGAFYLRRARRLYPALCVLVGLVLAIRWATPAGAGRVLLYLTDYGWLFGGTPGALAHTWSLAVEEHYYLLWPALLPVVMRSRRPVWMMLGLYVATTLWASAHLIAPADGFRFDTRMSGLVFGSLLAFLPMTSWLPLALLGLATLALGLGIPAGIPFAEAATACVLLLSNLTPLPFVTRPALVYVGRISYGVYLFHYPMTFMVPEAWGWQANLGLTLAGSLALASISYYTVERYFRTPRISDQGMQPSAA
jgi:peptidoglycan/LPS O-acetylase OafA/YrhL